MILLQARSCCCVLTSPQAGLSCPSSAPFYAPTCVCLLCALLPTYRPTQQSLSQAPDNIVAGRRAPLRSLGIADERHTQLVDVLTQVPPMRAARLFGGIREVGWLAGSCAPQGRVYCSHNSSCASHYLPPPPPCTTLAWPTPAGCLQTLDALASPGSVRRVRGRLGKCRRSVGSDHPVGHRHSAREAHRFLSRPATHATARRKVRHCVCVSWVCDTSL